MTVQEIALRNEIRQMMVEAGIDRNSIKYLAEQILRKRMDEQISNILNQTNLDALIRSTLNTYEFKNTLRNTISDVIRNSVDILVDVKTDIKCE